MGKEIKKMEKENFYILGIVTGVITFLLGFLVAPIECIICTIISLSVNMRKKSDYRIKIGVVLTIAGLVFGILGLVSYIRIGLNGLGSVDYWFFELLFGKTEKESFIC